MDHQISFSYLGKPWMKWMFFVIGALEIPVIFEKMSDYRSIADSGIYNSKELSEYLMQQKFSCMFNLILATVFIGIAVIDLIVRSKKSGKLAEAILYFTASVIYTAGMILWGSAMPSLPLFVIGLFVIWGIFVFTLLQWVREFRRHKA